MKNFAKRQIQDMVYQESRRIYTKQYGNAVIRRWWFEQDKHGKFVNQPEPLLFVPVIDHGYPARHGPDE